MRWDKELSELTFSINNLSTQDSWGHHREAQHLRATSPGGVSGIWVSLILPLLLPTHRASMWNWILDQNLPPLLQPEHYRSCGVVSLHLCSSTEILLPPLDSLPPRGFCLRTRWTLLDLLCICPLPLQNCCTLRVRPDELPASWCSLHSLQDWEDH